ncbi:MAG: YicC family protein [Nitrospinae bacterium CG22_combo_CG10-13_8_21_14_all_47_10]|nr:MAG: YicC family protein [Nitrospinae bacterium CG22_combo_CG10-13_8_21_14_all_47_10]
MLISMTGFGRAECQDGDYSYKAEIRSVNNRFIEITTRLPKAFLDIELPLKKLIKSHCARGSINVTITLANSNGNSGEWEVKPNLPLAIQYVEALREIQTSLGLEGQVHIDSLVGLRDIFKIEPVAIDPAKESLLLNMAESALASLQKMREEEGQHLQNDLSERIDSIEKHAGQIAKRQPIVIQEYKARLKEKIKLLNDGFEIDEARLAQEAAILADRCDITEEITRFSSHLNQFRKLFESKEPIGRKLEFITQEINREVNTMGSKSSDTQVANLVIEIKSTLEKIREQLANIE